MQEPTAAASVAATSLLYQTDSYLSNFDARIVGVSGSAVALDQTAFFPGGGGQMADRGALMWNGARLAVVSLRKEGDVVWHELEAAGGKTPDLGDGVRGELDWDFRFHMMRTHTALHTLTSVIFKDFGAQVTGGQMYPDRARMDFSIEVFTPEIVRAIERAVNERLAEGHPVKVYFLPRDEAFQIPDLIRTKINLLPPEIQTIRIVEIDGVDLQADGGTHVRNTGEVGWIRVVKTENKGKQNKRMEIALVDGDE
jgi:misacylated tRNA(Ala) deacylase